MNTTWFTSDLHLGHKNIITYQKNRNFKNIDEHNEAIINKLNELIKPKDTLWILGDVAFGKANLHYVKEINAKHKRLVLGNHDTYDAVDYISAGFSKVFGMVTFKEFLLTHAPVHSQQLDTRYKYNIHGHLHNESIDDKRYINVNWDITKPLTLEEIRQITEEK
jgi:calcineurin-like phosphoesterase family protein